MNRKSYRVALLGGGKSGRAAFRLLRHSGIPQSEICLIDHKSKDAIFEGLTSYSSLSEINLPEVLVLSPGVPLALAEIQEALRSGARLESEITLALPFLNNEKIIAVTGSMGKSTTTALIHFALEGSDHDAFIGGNFGFPLADYAADCLEKKRQPAEFLVLELSSFQLENCGDLKVDHSAIVSLASNHLERYESKADYFKTKWTILGRTKISAVLGSGSAELKAVAEDLKDFSIPHLLKTSWSENAEVEDALKTISKRPKLVGTHNWDNMRIAAQILMDAGLRASLPKLFDYPGLPHRLEDLGTRSGVRFFNDSKATSIESVRQALLTLKEEAGATKVSRVHCLVGGRDKKLPWENLKDFALEPGFVFHFFGECGELAMRRSEITGTISKSLAELLVILPSKVQAGDVVLLSPGGTSLDEFGNFEERGDYFRRFVEEDFEK